MARHPEHRDGSDTRWFLNASETQAAVLELESEAAVDPSVGLGWGELGHPAGLLGDRSQTAAVVVADPEPAAGLQGERGRVLPIGVLGKPARGAAVGLGTEDRALIGDVVGEAVGADRLRPAVPHPAVIRVAGPGAEHPDRRVAPDRDLHGALGLLGGRDVQRVVVDREAVADPGMRAVPLRGATRLLARLVGGVALGVRGLRVLLGLLGEGVLTFVEVGAALTRRARRPSCPYSRSARSARSRAVCASRAACSARCSAWSASRACWWG